MAESGISGCRILLVEDEAIVAMMLKEMLEELGCEVVATVARAADAIPALQKEAFDVAILDVKLGGQNSYSVAAALDARGIPFVFSTGYAAAGLAQGYGDRPLLRKPFRMDELEHVLFQLCQK